MAADLHSQLAGIFHKGLKSDPKMHKALSDAIGTPGADTGPYTKAEANYRPSEGEESCGDCSHFTAPSTCEVVSGKVSASGLCDHYEPAGETAAEATMTPPADTTEGASGG